MICLSHILYIIVKNYQWEENMNRFINNPDFVACHVPAYLEKYDILKGLKKGGTFLLNSLWDEEETKSKLPDHIKKYLAELNDLLNQK